MSQKRDLAADLGAIILTGGASSRMGADKARLDWKGARAVDRCAALSRKVGAGEVLTVGRQGFGYRHARDETQSCGPVGGIVTGAMTLATLGCRRALVLAVDAPTIEPADLAPLLGAPGAGAAFAELYLPLVFDLGRLPADAAPSWPVRRFVERAGLALLDCSAEQAERLRGANTPAERDRLLAAIS
ncbi:MAG: molybdenum cofactor guanylyltransferase [Caulobacteraceae bacterium]